MIARRFDRPARKHWHALTAAEKKQAVFDLIDGGMHVYSIAAATGLSVEAIRQLVAERREAADE